MWLLSLGLVVLLAGVECVYRASLAQVPAFPQKVTVPSLPESWNRVAWAHLEKTATPRVQPVWPTTIVFTVAEVVLRRPQSQSASQDMYPRGFGLADQVARQWVHLLAREEKRVSRLGQFALTIWLTRNWSAEELLAFKAHHLWFGRGLLGVSAAAPALLNKDAAQLDVSDVAFLLAVSEKAWAVACASDRLRRRRDTMLEEMHVAGAVTQAEVDAARSAPWPLAVAASGASCR
ncbi:transglycosylase domain-containing protein [Myxococcus sp. 1LA]